MPVLSFYPSVSFQADSAACAHANGIAYGVYMGTLFSVYGVERRLRGVLASLTDCSNACIPISMTIPPYVWTAALFLEMQLSHRTGV